MASRSCTQATPFEGRTMKYFCTSLLSKTNRRWVLPSFASAPFISNSLSLVGRPRQCARASATIVLNGLTAEGLEAPVDDTYYPYPCESVSTQAERSEAVRSSLRLTWCQGLDPPIVGNGGQAPEPTPTRGGSLLIDRPIHHS
jgi:hypothetical protein